MFKGVQLVLYAGAILLLTHMTQCDIANFDEKCVVNASKPAEEDGNYIDCNTPEQIEAKETRCCEVEGKKGCCSEETPNDKMIAIGTTIAVVTVSVATACFIVFWCNPETIPWLQRCPCKCCKRGSDEFSEMTDLTDTSKGHINQSYVKERNHDEYAPPERYDMPEELKGNVEDDWWGSPQGAVQY